MAWVTAPPGGPGDLKHGYTLADLNRLARAAICRTGTFASDVTDRYNTAWSAIAEALYAADHPPTERDLIYAGRDAVWSWLHCEAHAHGIAPLRGGEEHQAMPRFVLFWWSYSATMPSPETAIVDRLALRQSITALAEPLRVALLAAASHGSARAASAVLGIPVRTFTARVTEARRQLVASWLAGETPVRAVMQPRRADRDVQPCGTHAAYFRHRRRGETQDEACIAAWNAYRKERAAVRAELTAA